MENSIEPDSSFARLGSANLRRAVFLDRDGVLNRAVVRNGRPYPPASLQELEITPGTRESLLELRRRGMLLIVVTNQPDVSRGTQTVQAVNEINQALMRALPLDEVLVCFHDDQDNCACRKPRPGLLLQAATKYGLSLHNSFLVGDRPKDIDAGHAAGCATVLIDHGYTEALARAVPDARVSSLDEAVRWIADRLDARTRGAGTAIG